MNMETDAGAKVPNIAEDTLIALFPLSILSPSNIVLKIYIHEYIPLMGEAQFSVGHEVTSQRLRLVVVAGKINC